MNLAYSVEETLTSASSATCAKPVLLQVGSARLLDDFVVHHWAQSTLRIIYHV